MRLGKGERDRGVEEVGDVAGLRSRKISQATVGELVALCKRWVL